MTDRLDHEVRRAQRHVDPHLSALVGRRLGPTQWRTVTQDDIDAFARISGDHQWIHVDAERATRESPFGTTIAHGNLTLAHVDGIRDALLEYPAGWIGVNLGYDRVRFPAPVPSGARLRGWVEVTAVQPHRDGWWRVTQRFDVEVEGATKPAVVADSVILIRAAGS